MDKHSSLLFKYIIIGDSGVGKSCFLIQFTDQKFKNQHQLTIGIQFGNRVLQVDKKQVVLQIWDTAGQEGFRSLIRSYYRGAAAALLMYDISNRESFFNLSKWVQEIQQNANNDISIVLVGNKVDLESERAISTEMAQEFAEIHNMKFVEASAKNGVNVEEAFAEAARTILGKIEGGQIVFSQAQGVQALRNTDLNQNFQKKRCSCQLKGLDYGKC